MNIHVDLKSSGVPEKDILTGRNSAKRALDTLLKGEMDFSGWVDAPLAMAQNPMEKVAAMAKKIRQQCDTFLVLGVGGSFMGAKAVIDALGPSRQGCPSVVFAGYNFSGRYLGHLLEQIREDHLCICLISKSGTTAETLAAYGIFKEWMEKKYGKKEAAARTTVITENILSFSRRQPSGLSPQCSIPLGEPL